jgi:hypothetical protein
MRRCAAIAVVVVASVASAQPPADHAKAVELFEEGRRLITGHDPAGACAKFAESIRLEPLAAGTMLNLGLCHQQLGHLKTALHWFRKAQLRATETDPPLPAYEQEAREHTVYLATVVATIKIDATAAPQDVQVSIDDEPVRPEDYAHLEIDPGTHTLVATATGKATFRRELDVTGRGGQTVVLAFPDPQATPPVETPSDEGQRRRISLYVAIGGGALLVGSLGLTLYEKHVYNEHKDGAMRGDAGALDETRNATKIARNYGTGLALAGIVAAGVASYLYFTAPSETVVAPVVSPGQVGAVVTRRF